MKKNIRVLPIMFLAAFLFYGNVYALTIGKNITVADGQTGDGAWYQGRGQGNEDEETEPGTSAENTWDLEGMFLSDTTLSLVGEWDFINGEDMTQDWESSYDADNDHKYTSGDIFIDAKGVDNGGAYGYDYVFDVDWSRGTYNIFSLSSNSRYIRSTYRTPYSDPWKVDTTDTDVIASGSFDMTQLDDTQVAETGFLGDTHNMVSFDLSAIPLDLQLGFTAHFTMECGNDDLVGTAPVPEPATIILMGCGLFGIAGFTRKKLKLERPA